MGVYLHRLRSGRFGHLVLLVAGVLFVAPGVGTSAAQSAASKPASKTSSARSATTSKARPASKRYSRSASRARQRRLAAARARRELAALSKPIFKTDEAGHMVPHVRAAAAIVYDPLTGEVLWEENSQDQRPIASITKLMTALVFLDEDPDLEQLATVDTSDVRAASVTHLIRRERINVRDLLHLMLVSSDNGAARALARISPGGTQAFVARMNEKAVELGLERTQFADPSGLNAGNVSSAYDISRLIALAAHDERIGPTLRQAEYTFRTNRRVATVKSTNKLLGGEVDVQAGKTGFIRLSGYCMASLLRLPQGQNVAVVVLGAGSSAARFMEVRHLFNWLSSGPQGLLAGSTTSGGQ